MISSQIQQEECLDEQFGYDWFFDLEPRSGWLINYNIIHTDQQNDVILYFVDNQSNNFKIKLRFYPSVVVDTTDNQGVEEYLLRKYEGEIQKIEITTRIDSKEYNHLNKESKNMLKIFFKSDIGHNKFIRDIKELIFERKSADAGYMEIINENMDAKNMINNIYEYDITPDILVATSYNIRCGSWFNISYDGVSYKIDKNDEVGYPPLRIMAYDIETTKPALKFPNSNSDQIMMISLMTESFGELIINREIVSQDIQEFDYSPKPEISTTFRVDNEQSEEALLIRFIEVIQQTRPHIITTFNGGFFDFEFVDKRLAVYNMNLTKLIGFSYYQEYYDCPFMIHLDCYKWVKRDSYLPMSSQGLKAATKAKLGYYPDEIDPEDMMRCAVEDPQKMASYSVSDAVATYLLYDKYVHPHIFSISSIIPLPPVQILTRGSGTLCEALLISQAFEYKVLVPTIKRDRGLSIYEGHIAENLTYVGGHVESLKAGVFRSDFEHEFNIDFHTINMIIDGMDDMLSEYTKYPDYQEKKEFLIKKLKSNIGKIIQKGEIYHLDVGAMYPNIILTNRLQPISMVDNSICVRCDYNDDDNKCKRKMNWVSRAEYYPPSEGEIQTIKNRLKNEKFYTYENKIEILTPYNSLPKSKQNSLLIERIAEYSKQIYKKTKIKEEKLKEITICQREVPFYVETVRKFRDQRYVYKELYKKAAANAELNPSRENKNKAIIYNSLQTAYKCVLNSFYGYVMRKGSRWFSIEMAAVTCNTGGEIIKLARSLLDGIGIPLELDTDGIWAIIPSNIPDVIYIGEKKISFLANILNYFVCKKFTNNQYQTLSNNSTNINNTNNYEIISQNSIYFEIDGPYKTMVIPSSTEENRLLKKRYVVFNNDGNIAELKGFELKRRGELNLIKKFQEDIFEHFNDGCNLEELYSSLAEVSNYWLDIIYSKGETMDDNSIFHLFSESRSMSKEIGDYANKKSNILSTAKRLAEFLGDEILGDKLKCEFIISKFPEGEPIASRAVPVLIFKSEEKLKYLEKWLGKLNSYELKDIIDWEYYKGRFEDILRRLIVLPAHFQNILNPIDRVGIPKWANKEKGSLKFKKVDLLDFEDYGKSEGLVINKKKEDFALLIQDDGIIQPLSSDGYTNSFFTKNKRVKTEIIENVSFEHPKKLENDINSGECNDIIENDNIKADKVIIASKFDDFSIFLKSIKSNWLDFYNLKLKNAKKLLFIEFDKNTDKYTIVYFNGKKEVIDFVREIYLGINDSKYFEKAENTLACLPGQSELEKLFILKLNSEEYLNYKKTKFFDHFSIKNMYNLMDPMFQILYNQKSIYKNQEYLILTSFQYQKKPIYCVSNSQNKTCVFISELKIDGIDFTNIKSYKYSSNINLALINKSDCSIKTFKAVFDNLSFIETDMKVFMKISGFFENFERLKELQIDLHKRMIGEFLEKVEIAKLTEIPILNINENILDYYFYNTMMDSKSICTQSEGPCTVVVRDETYKSGYYGTYVIQLELCHSLILSIIEYESFIQTPNFYGVKTAEFKVLKNFITNLMILSAKENIAANKLIENIDFWLKRGSNLISKELRETITILQQQYLIGLLKKLKEMQIKVICLSKEIIFVDTEKKDLKGCQEYTKYMINGINSISEYEVLGINILRTFEKIGFVDPCTYFYLSEGSYFTSGSNYNISTDFFKLYFSEEEIKNEQIYDIVGKMDINSAKMLLRILSYKRDVHGLASNCYKLLKSSEFTKDFVFQPNLTVFCQGCGFENYLRNTCVKCHADIDKNLIENECLKYLQFCWKQQVDGDRYCSICNNYEERKLKEYCRCGGKFMLKDYSEEILAMQKFVGTKRFDEEVNKMKEYFNN